MKCRLCLKEKELCKAHVIAKFMFKDIFYKNRILEVNFRNLDDRKKRQDGAYDYNILCKKCDSRLSKFETYASNAIYNKKSVDCIVIEDVDIKTIVYKGINYKKFKLFLLSNLWRASVSSLKMFQEVSLGRNHEEAIRRMIYEENPGDQNEYPCWIFKIDESVNRFTKTIASPKKIKQNSNTSYVFLINNYFYWYNISPYNIMDVILKTTIDHNNEFSISILKGGIADQIVDSFYGFKLVKKGT